MSSHQLPATPHGRDPWTDERHHRHVIDVTDTFEQVDRGLEGFVVSTCGLPGAPVPDPRPDPGEGCRSAGAHVAKLTSTPTPRQRPAAKAVKSQHPHGGAFRDGQPVSMFIGAYPEEEVNKFVDELVPSEAELEAEEARWSRRRATRQRRGRRPARPSRRSPQPRRVDRPGWILLARGEDEAAAALAEPSSRSRGRAHHGSDPGARVGSADPFGPSNGPRWRRRRSCSRGTDAMLSHSTPIPTGLDGHGRRVHRPRSGGPGRVAYRPKLAARLF
jgi:hypothetical protein